MPAAVRSTTMLRKRVYVVCAERIATIALFSATPNNSVEMKFREFAIAPKRLIAFSQGVVAKILGIVRRRHRASHP